jgi:single-strand DNA-binding protein
MTSIIGRLGRDPELTQTASGVSLCKFSVAQDFGYGENKKTFWWNCVAFGKTAETIAQYLAKGRGIICEDFAPDYSEWEKDGEKRHKTTFIVNRFTFPPQDKGAPATGGGTQDDDDDLPF